MATESFTTEYKFNKKSISKILKAMEAERDIKFVNVDSIRLSDKDEIRSLLRDTTNQ